MRLLDEGEILFWEYFEKLQHNWQCSMVHFYFSLWFSVISHVYYKGVAYCHLIGISLTLTSPLKTLLCGEVGGGGGGGGIEKGFLVLLIMEYCIGVYWSVMSERDFWTLIMVQIYSITNCLCWPQYIQLPGASVLARH